MKKRLLILLEMTFLLPFARFFRSTSAPIPIPANLPAPVFEAPPRLVISQSEWKTIQAAPEYSPRRAAALNAGEALLKNPVVLPKG